MNDYMIITDSTCDLSPKLVSELEVEVIPMEFSIGDDTYRNYPDEREISSHDFYDLLRGGKTSVTNQITPMVLTDILEPILQSGKDILYIVFSSGLSATFNNAFQTTEELQKKYPERKVYAVDSRSASFGEGLLVYHAAKKRAEGLSIEDLRDWITENRGRLAHWFTVDDLNHLKRGGRVSGAAALVGTVLGIKPVLHVDDDGHLIPIEKVRGRRQSLDALVEHMAKTAEEPENQVIFIGHGDSLQDAEYVARQVKERFGVKRVEINSIGPVIGTHSGPGTVALFYLGKNRS